jgi:PAS domain S-box-containing protein
MFGYAREETLQFDVASWPMADDLFSAAEAVHRIRAAKSGPQVFEWKARRKNGEVFWAEVSLRCIVIGRRKRVVAVIRDIANRRRTEHQLRFQSMLLDQISDTVTATDLDGNIIFVNDAQCRGIGRSREELLRASVHVYGEDPEHGFTQSQIIEMTRAQGSWRGVIVNRTADGREYTVDCRTTLLRDSEGRPIGMCGVGTDITEHIRLERELAGNVARLQAIVEAEPECVKILAPSGALLEMNSAGLRMLEADSLAEMQSRSLLACVAPEHQPAFRALHNRVMQGESGSLEFEAIGLKGRHCWLETHAAPLLDPVHGCVNLLGVTRDVTSRKRAEEALRKANERERLYFDQTPLGVIEWDLDFRVTRWNPAAERVFGYPPAEAMGQHASFIVPEAERPFVDVLWRQLLSKQGGERSTNGNVCQDGRAIFCEWYNTPLADEQGRVIGVVSLVMDITESHRAEEALAEREKRYRSLFDLSPAGILLEDTEGNILEVNAATCRIFGYAREEMLGRNVHILVPEELHSVVDGHIRDLLAGKTLLHVVDNIAKDGQLRRVELHEMTVPLPDGRRGILVVMNDITERRQLEEQLRHLQKMESIGQLAAGVAHDFNNILTVINGSAAILSESLSDKPQHMEWVNHILASGERAANLTRQLLLFSRKQQMQPKLINLNELTSNLTKMLGRVLGEDITLEFSYENDLPSIQGDAGMLEQVILNLTVNARDAMPQGGSLHIATGTVNFSFLPPAANPGTQPGRFVKLVVRDTGTGIPPEIRERIFEPFFTTKEVGKGTGLGLATAFGIVAQHNGWIEVDSRPGQGTAFLIYLPASTATVAASGRPAASALEPGHGEIILVVEDDPSVRELVCRTLSRQGYKVTMAASGVEARMLSAEFLEQVKLMVTDLVMPGGVNGRELAESLRRTYPRLRVVYCSGYSSEITGGRLSLDPGCLFLQKPFTPLELLHAVAECLRP